MGELVGGVGDHVGSEVGALVVGALVGRQVGFSVKPSGIGVGAMVFKRSHGPISQSCGHMWSLQLLVSSVAGQCFPPCPLGVTIHLLRFCLPTDPSNPAVQL